MQWNASGQAGFTTGPKSWLAVNPNYKEINAAQELADPNSVYHYTQHLIALRHATPALVYGDYKDVDPANPDVFAYTRTLGAERFLVVLNFSAKAMAYTVPDGLKPTKLVMSNVGSKGVGSGTLNLKGWEARVYRY
jgi:oligo-1,6-glucosidase